MAAVGLSVGIRNPKVYNLRPIGRGLLHSYWPLAQRFIAEALEHAADELTLDDVLMRLLMFQSHLFLLMDGKVVAGALTVEIQEFPKKRVALIAQLGGKNLPRIIATLPQLNEWAKEHRCDTIGLWGRSGWERVLPDFDKKYVYLERGV